MPSVSVVVQARSTGPALEALIRPIRADPATLETLVLERDAGVEAARGDVVLFVDEGVLATRGLVSAHARHHAADRRLLVLGYTPIRVLHERAPADFAARLRAPAYESRCNAYERDGRAILTSLWGGNFSLRRRDCVAAGLTGEEARRDLAIGRLCLEAGIDGVFDRALRALRIYEPSLSGFARDAHAEGLDRFGERSPSRATHAAASLALRALVLAGGSAHVWRVQDGAARLLWEVEARRGTSPAGR